MRIAWNVRVAGCLPGSRVGTAAATMAASCPVARDRLDGAGRHDGAGNAPGEPLLAERAQHGDDVALAGPCQPLRRALPRLVVHPHIERPVLHETEAATGLVELRRRDPQVHQHALQLPFQTRRPDPLLELAERPPYQRETWLPRESHLPGPDRVRVPVDRDHAAGRPERAENRGGVPSTPERRVAVPTVGPHREPGQHFVGKYRRVLHHLRA